MWPLRGLDIPAVSHVFNYDVPHHAEDYVHRIGRDRPRGPASGAAFSIVTHEDAKSVAAIEKLIGNPIPWIGEPLGDAPPRGKRDDRRAGGRDDKHRKKGGRDRERRRRSRRVRGIGAGPDRAEACGSQIRRAPRAGKSPAA